MITDNEIVNAIEQVYNNTYDKQYWSNADENPRIQGLKLTQDDQDSLIELIEREEVVKALKELKIILRLVRQTFLWNF